MPVSSVFWMRGSHGRQCFRVAAASLVDARGFRAADVRHRRRHETAGRVADHARGAARHRRSGARRYERVCGEDHQRVETGRRSRGHRQYAARFPLHPLLCDHAGADLLLVCVSHQTRTGAACHFSGVGLADVGGWDSRRDREPVHARHAHRRLERDSCAHRAGLRNGEVRHHDHPDSENADGKRSMRMNGASGHHVPSWWQAFKDFYLVYLPLRFNIVLVALIAYVFMLNAQGHDIIARLVGQTSTGAAIAFDCFVLLLALQVWFWSRQLLYLIPKNPPASRFPFWTRWIPRLLGIIAQSARPSRTASIASAKSKHGSGRPLGNASSAAICEFAPGAP